MNIHKWKRIQHDENHRVGWRHIMLKKFEMPDGKILDYGIYDKEGSVFVAIIALTKDNKVVVARQFRPGPEMIMDELPGGSAEPDEDPKKAALRELIEETGYQPKRVAHLGVVRKEAYRNGIHHYFIGFDCIKVGDPRPDQDEYVEAVEISVSQLIDNAKKGRMTDSSAILLAYDILLDS